MKLFTVCSFLIKFLLLLVIIIQCIVKIGFITEMFIPNYQLLFFKLTQLAQLSQKNLGKPRLDSKCQSDLLMLIGLRYRSGTVNSNTVNSKFHLIRSYCEIFFYNFPNIPCLKYTVNSNFHLIRSKTLPMNDFELTVPDL